MCTRFQLLASGSNHSPPSSRSPARSRMDRTTTRSSRSSSHVSSTSSVHSLYDHDSTDPPTPGAGTPFGGRPQDDPALLHDAISALRIMRSGSVGGGGHDSPPAASTSAAAPAGGSGAGSRSGSGSASTASASGSWATSDQTPSTGASTPSGPPSHTAESDQGDQLDPDELAESDPNFIARVSQLPLVSGSLEWYERSKRSSRVVKVSFQPVPPAPHLQPLARATHSALRTDALNFAVRCRAGRIVLFSRLAPAGQQPSDRRAGRLCLPPARPLLRHEPGRRVGRVALRAHAQGRAQAGR